MSKLSQVELALRFYRKRGDTVAITSHWNAFSARRTDLLGFMDFLAFSIDRGFVGVQVTSSTNHAGRRQKIIKFCTVNAIAWLKAGGKINIISFFKEDGIHWKEKLEEITLDHFLNKE
jgi:hypothetical protein